jgi:hypothetical protein
LLRVEEGIREVFDRQGTGVRSRRATGVQVVLLFQVLLQGAVGIISGAEVVQLAADLLGPYAGGMGEERKVKVGLGGLAGMDRRGRMGLGDGDYPIA